MRISITGHQRVQVADDWNWVRAELNNIMVKLPKPLIGVTSLAIGADQLFAELILKHGGTIEAVLPFPEYELKLEVADRPKYQRLLEMASKVIALRKEGSDEQSYFEAGKRVIDLADLVIAVWDGEPAKGFGGTADVVEYAKQKRKDTIHLNPVEHTVNVHTHDC